MSAQPTSATMFRLPKAPGSVLYTVALVAVSSAMLLLPLLYAGVVGLVGWGVYLFVIRCVPAILQWHLGFSHITLLAIFVCSVTPIVTGLAVVFFMLKPIFARRGRAPVGAVHNPAFEPRISEFTAAVCDAVGAPAPSRIEFDCSNNASAGFASGWGGFLRKRMVLRLGLSLVAVMSERELAGILAHEFAHFRQGWGMRLSFLIRSVNGWFARFVYERDAWDERLEDAIESQQNWLGAMSAFAAVGVAITRAVLWVFMMLGHGISAFLMRQMEFDADAAEIGLAGSAAFISTTKKLSALDAMRGFADQQINEIWRLHQHLPDNLPVLLEHRMRNMPADVAAAIEAHIHTTKTHWLATHPSAYERICQAEQLRCAGQQLADSPARELFRDFEALCAAVTIGHYHNLGVPNAASRLMPVKLLTAVPITRPSERVHSQPIQAATVPFAFAAEMAAEGARR